MRSSIALPGSGVNAKSEHREQRDVPARVGRSKKDRATYELHRAIDNWRWQ